MSAEPDTHLVQLSCRRLTARRVPRDQQPVFETMLGAHQRIVQVHAHALDDPRRSTVDHTADVWVESRL